MDPRGRRVRVNLGGRLTHSTTVQRARALLEREDLRRRPIRGLLRRVVWRLRWLLHPNAPWLLRTRNRVSLWAPKGGAGALIYYQGATEPDTMEFFRRVLKPGMVFVDVGAHLGEYTVLAATILGRSGYVHAFEPRPDIFELLTRNIQLNHCRNVTVRPFALWHENGWCEFEVTPEPSVSAIRSVAPIRRGAKIIKVRAVTLDDYFARIPTCRPDLIKIDVEGAELHVLRGARSVLDRSAVEAPKLIVEYEPPNQARFGYSFTDVFAFLAGLGYNLYGWQRGRLVRVHKCGEDLVYVDASPVSPSNLIAAKVLPAVSSMPN